MSLLSYNNLVHLVEQKVITNVEHDQINASSIDLTLGPDLLVEGLHPAATPLTKGGYHLDPTRRVTLVNLRERTPLFTQAHNLELDGPYDLMPGEFILASTAQIFNLPRNVSAEYKLKSSMARIGLEHLNAGWCDAGWNGSALTLELKNMNRHHAIRIQAGDRIGQVVFFIHAEVPVDRSYAARGRYNGDETVSGIKP